MTLRKDGGTPTTLSGLLTLLDDRNEDADGDGIPEWQEEDTYGTSDTKRDTDGDGVNDPLELADGTDPTNATSFNPLNKGLVAYYPFDGNANDFSGNGTHLMVFGPTQVDGRKGIQGDSAYVFREGDYLLGVRNLGVVGNSARTISLWVRIDPSTQTSQLMGYGPNSGAGAFFSLDYDGVSSPNAVASLS